MEENEVFEDNVDIVENDEDTDEEYDEEVSIMPGVVTFGLGALAGVVIDRVVIPAVGNAFDSARKGLIKLLEKKDYVEVDSEDDKSEDSEN